MIPFDSSEPPGRLPIRLRRRLTRETQCLKQAYSSPVTPTHSSRRDSHGAKERLRSVRCEVCLQAAVRSLMPCHRVHDQRTRGPAKRRTARRSSMLTTNSSDAPAITKPSTSTLSVTIPTKSASAMLTITRRLFKMFLLLSHINARTDPNVATNG